MADLNLQALVDEGLSGTEVLARMRAMTAPAATADDLWRRLALLIRFDATLYAAATRDVPDAPRFDAVAASPDVRRLDGRPDMVAVTPEKRKAVFEPAVASPDAIRRVAATLLRALDARGRSFELDALAVSLVADAKEGTTRFKALYGAADAGLDIPRCTQVLEILRARLPLAESLLELYYDYNDYFRARTVFVEDFYRSAAYLDRPAVRQAFEDFWKSDKWLLRLYGKGGRGKTMFLRWLIARRCLPRGGRKAPIAVARVDFDELSLTAFDDHPWLVLLPIMKQLSPQLPNRPFQTLIHDLDEYSAYLRTAEHERDVSATLQARKAPAIEQFRQGLGAHPVLLVFDTCEEPLIHRRAAFVQLLETFADARRRTCPNLRLMLSGRYDLEDRGLDAFASGSGRIEVTPFDDTEATKYLTRHRGLARGALVRAIVAKSAGNPFNLGLFADLAASPEGLSLQEVRDAPRAEFIYLLDRVILRIPQEPVRWLVRYAAIPRELTFDFASQVVAPLLHGTSRDQPNRFATEALARRYAAKQPWPKANLADMTKVWEDLRAYASNPSWIVWNDEAKSLKLQAEVVGPMRLLLQENRAFYDALHQRAERYWRRRGRATRASYAAAVAEEFFHKFHRLGPAAGRDWRSALDDPRMAETSDRLRLAEVVLDLLGERSRLAGDESAADLVDARTVLRARAEVALAALAARLKLGRITDADARTYTEKLTDQWHAISRAPDALVRRVISRGELKLLRAGYSYLRLRKHPALAPLRALTLPPRLKLLARMLAGRLSYERYFMARTTDARDFDVALALSTKLGSKDFPPDHVWFRAGMLHVRTGDVVQANQAFEHAWRLTPRGDSWPPGSVETFWRLAQGLRMAGRWTQVLGLADAVPSGDRLDQSRLLFQVWHARTTIAMDLGDVVGARRALDEAKSFTDSSVEAVWQELAAEVALLAYDVPAADTAISTARSLYPRGGLGRLRMDVLEASALVVSGARKAARGRLRRRQPYYWSLWLEDAETRIRAGVAVPPRLQSRSWKVGATVLRARVLAAALAHGRTKDPMRFLQELATLDDQARFAALVPFEETDRVFAPADPRQDAWLDRALPAAPANTSHVSFVQRVALANALRFFGRHRQALDLLRRTTPSTEPAIEWRRLRALAGTGVFDASTTTALKSFHDRVSALPSFVAAVTVEGLEWALRHGPHAAAVEIGERAEPMRAVVARIGPGWVARLALATGELRAAQARWNDAAALLREAEATAKSAGQPAITRRAAAKLRELGDRTTEEAPASATPPLVPVVDEWRFTRRSQGEVVLQARLASGAGFKQPYPVPHGLGQQIEPGADPVEIVRLLTADHRFRDRLVKTARFRLEAGALSALPWEILAPEGAELFYRSALEDAAVEETARWMQLALRAAGRKTPLTPDVAHPGFQRALAEFRADHTTSLHEALHAAVVKAASPTRSPSPVFIGEPNPEWQYSNRRGYAPRNTSLASAYTGFSVEHVASLSMTSSPSVIHLAGIFNDPVTSAQAIELDPQASRRADWPGAWSAHTIGSLTAGIPEHRVKPLVILDALSTASAVDATLEGLRRNTMCAEVFEQGAARAVLGFGLAQPGHERACLDILLSAVRENVSVGRLHARLLAARDRFVFPPALWADDPHLPADIDL